MKRKNDCFLNISYFSNITMCYSYSWNIHTILLHLKAASMKNFWLKNKVETFRNGYFFYCKNTKIWLLCVALQLAVFTSSDQSPCKMCFQWLKYENCSDCQCFVCVLGGGEAERFSWRLVSTVCILKTFSHVSMFCGVWKKHELNLAKVIEYSRLIGLDLYLVIVIYLFESIVLMQMYCCLMYI